MALTSKEKQKRFRQRQTEKGLVFFQAWVSQAQLARIKKILSKDKQKETEPPPTTGEKDELSRN